MSMQVSLNNPKRQAKWEQWAADTGRPASELVEDVVTGYFEDLEDVRHSLDSRYDDVKSGKVELIDGEDFFEKLRQREEELLKHRL